MKWGKFSIALLIAIVICLAAFITFAGVSFDGGIHRFWPAGAIRGGIDYAGGAYAVYRPEEGEGVADEVGQVFEIIKKRLDVGGVSDARISRLSDNGIRVEIPTADSGTLTDSKEILDYIGAVGLIRFLDPDKNVILDSGAITGASFGYASTAGYYVKLTLTKEGDAALEKATTELTGKQVTVMIDDAQLSTITVSQVIKGGVVSLSGSFDEAQARVLAGQLDAGCLPIKMTISESGQFTTNSGSALGLGLAALLAVLLIAFLVAYRALGAAIDFALLAYASAYTFLFVLFKIKLTPASLAGAISALILFCALILFVLTRFSEECSSGKTPAGAMTSAWKKSLIATIDLCAAGGLLFAAILLIPGAGAYRAFGSAALLGAAHALVLTILLVQPMTWLIVKGLPAKSGLYLTGKGGAAK